MGGLIWPVREQLLRLRDGNSLLKDRATAILLQWSNPPEDPVEWCDLMLQSDRLAKISAAGRENDAALIQKLMHETEPKTWYDLPTLNVTAERQKMLAENMLKQVKLYPNNLLSSEEQLTFSCSFPLRTSIEHAVRIFKDTHANVDVQFNDAAFTTALLNALDEDSAKRYGVFLKSRYKNTTHALNMYAEPDEDEVGKLNENLGPILTEARMDFRQRANGGSIRWCLANIPSKTDAKIDGIPYDDYINYYFDACDQPWDAIYKAQATLIEKALNPGHMLRITNDGGTEVFVPTRFHTFTNSTIQRNQPGSEMFTGPDAECVTGTIVSKGNFTYTLDGKLYVMKDITLKIHKGEVVEAHAEEGNECLQKILSCEDDLPPDHPKYRGARRIGEIGIGTNPFIKQHLANTMLVEKISGSFHLAVGGAYGNSYPGETNVLMDNGNKSKVHWDITTMLRGKGGTIAIDGHVLQKDGVWVACPELGIREEDVAVLNDGWKAIPNHLRPERWRDEAQAQQTQR